MASFWSLLFLHVSLLSFNIVLWCCLLKRCVYIQSCTHFLLTFETEVKKKNTASRLVLQFQLQHLHQIKQQTLTIKTKLIAKQSFSLSECTSFLQFIKTKMGSKHCMGQSCQRWSSISQRMKHRAVLEKHSQFACLKSENLIIKSVIFRIFTAFALLIFVVV